MTAALSIASGGGCTNKHADAGAHASPDASVVMKPTGGGAAGNASGLSGAASSAGHPGSSNAGNSAPGPSGAPGPGNAGSSSARHFNAPAVAPIVREATPSALKPTAALRVLQSVKSALALLAPIASAHAQPMTDVDLSIKALFNDMYNRISGGQSQGLINSSLEDLDSRMTFVDMAASTSTCLNAPAHLHRIDLRAIAPAIDFTLHLQCNAGMLMAFGRDDSGVNVFADADGGAEFDPDASVAGQGPMYSLWLYLSSMTDAGGFGYYANVYDVGTGRDSVDFLFLENHPSLARIQAYRVKAQPSTRRFEFVYGATDGGGPSGDNLRCGFKMISDGSYVWAVGKDRQPGQACADAAAFTRCLAASDLSRQASSAPCRALAKSFTLEAPTADALASAGTDVLGVLPVATSASETTPF